MAQKKAPVIDLPIKMFFSDAGVNFFIENNKKMNKFTMADNTDQYGILLRQFSPPSVQHMIRVGYISRIEVSRAEYTSKRAEIMDLCKLIVYGYLYKLFEEEVFNQVIDSDIIHDWNRSNPGNAITRTTKINEQFLTTIIDKNKSFVAGLKKDITRNLMNDVMADTSLQADEKNIKIFLMDKFLGSIRPFVWFILIKFNSSIEYQEIVNTIRIKLGEYIKKSKIAEYISLMLMELNISAESMNLKNYIDKKSNGTIPIESIMFDPEKRVQVMKELENSQKLISSAWILGSRKSHTIGTDRKLQLIVYNKGAEFLGLKESVDKKMNTDIKDISLTDFYKTSNTSNADMGMYYLSYLVDECDKMDIKFSSRVNQITDALSYITLTLTL